MEGARIVSEHEPVVWKTLSSQRVFGNRWIGVVVDEVELPDGRRYEYTRLEPAGIGVGVIGFNAAGEILLEREYRHGVGEVVWQVPGGLAAPGESLQEAGLRELLEETGYVAEQWRRLGSYAVDANRGAGTAHLFLATGARWQQPIDADDLEEQELLLLDRQSVERALLDGEFKVLPWAANVALALLALDQIQTE